MTIRQHRVRWWLTGGPSAGDPTDLSCEVFEASIHHGRDDPGSQPEASSATVDIPGPMPTGMDVMQWLQVETRKSDGSWLPRFTGRVTDLGVEYELGIDLVTGDTYPKPFTRVIAAGQLADMGRRYVGDAPWPQELDGDRIWRILGLVGMGTDRAQVDPGVVQILPRDVDRQPALDLAQDVAEDAGGILWMDTAGVVRYADSEHRRAARAALTLDACQVIMSPAWVRGTGGLLNEVAIGYGPEPEGGEQAVSTAVNTAAQATYGRLAYSAGTQLATLADAEQRAGALLARNAFPVWNMAAIEVLVPALDDPTTDALLLADLGTLLGLTGLPLNVPDGQTSTALWVEGWTETLGWHTHELTVNVSGYCRTAPFPRWDDTDPSITWDSVKASRTWDGMGCGGPVVTVGRWNDQPATLFWDQVAPTETWDTYSG